MWGRRIVGMAAVAAAIAVGGCGDDDEPAAKGTDLTALKCPLEPTGKQVGGIDEYRPAKDAFDTKELIGAEIGAARDTAAEHGCEIEVAMEDGKGLPVDTDIDPKRIYVYTEDGVVTRVEGVGGGI
jgi:hypothetical protein